MRFELTDEQKEFQKTFHAFCEKEIAPRAHEIDVKGVFSPENWKALAGYGYFRLPFPEKYGGYGADSVTCAIAWEELTRVCASTALSAGANISLVTMPIFRFGTEDHKEKYLKKLITGEYIGSFCLTEPGCGSDAGGLKTVAVKKNGKYILNGTKMFATNGSVANVYLVLAVTDKEKKEHGISMFIVERGWKGVTPGNPLDKMGCRASPTTEMVFEDVEVPAENLVGVENQGYTQALKTLTYGRVGMAAWSLGIAQAAMEESIKYARERQAFGKPIGYFQAIAFKIADMKVWTDTARLLTHHAAWLQDQGKPNRLEASVAKLFASEIAMQAANMAVQIHGGYGYIKEYKVERLFRDAKLGEIGEGTSEIQRMVIAREILAG